MCGRPSTAHTRRLAARSAQHKQQERGSNSVCHYRLDNRATTDQFCTRTHELTCWALDAGTLRPPTCRGTRPVSMPARTAQLSNGSMRPVQCGQSPSWRHGYREAARSAGSSDRAAKLQGCMHRVRGRQRPGLCVCSARRPLAAAPHACQAPAGCSRGASLQGVRATCCARH